MSFRIRKEFHFSASHRLSHLPDDHPCARLHGHNYVVVVELSAEAPGPDGFVRDYRELAAFKDHIDETLDHRHLDDVLDVPSTAENLARHLFDWCAARWPETSAVAVSETPKTWAEYRP
ncbi:6-pyruvoyl tetrahydropterin synthase family protein [Palleronia sp. LCG004]|uniref:6-pyruvoyl trahydropterin synthase family protein n=1 Tax=Palleronia sp. LCG004 TaxID=3079304 RepID=UPI0029435B33|nr:6-pyruvoyl tetrahydropterin synthase family protein [Palleronia sp. LCG004]WOI57720.1 6-pyruvoyl tetrahydropterin synthase family protein [Palleronia sp. LCG004]